ncbi:hypothetical protein [Microcoleus sp. PH2017_05_CCC_O_A]|nr:hypothetical protein [Microcoleus sp. PH2017_05_CCC_O_A]MCC3511389.1 hypothetical protein [Microcoleus sp. PH2017_17_BER_D_A]
MLAATAFIRSNRVESWTQKPGLMEEKTVFLSSLPVKKPSLKVLVRQLWT